MMQQSKFSKVAACPTSPAACGDTAGKAGPQQKRVYALVTSQQVLGILNMATMTTEAWFAVNDYHFFQEAPEL